MKRIIPVLLSMLLLTGCVSSGNSSDSSQSTRQATEKITYRQISMAQAVAMMESESDYIILDVRTPEEFRERRIPNSINVPNETIGKSDISELPNKDQLIFVYCRSGSRGVNGDLGKRPFHISVGLCIHKRGVTKNLQIWEQEYLKEYSLLAHRERVKLYLLKQLQAKRAFRSSLLAVRTL